MTGIYQLKRRVDGLQPRGGLSDSEIALRNMSDEEVLARVTQTLKKYEQLSDYEVRELEDGDLILKCRTITARRAGK